MEINPNFHKTIGDEIDVEKIHKLKYQTKVGKKSIIRPEFETIFSERNMNEKSTGNVP